MLCPWVVLLNYEHCQDVQREREREREGDVCIYICVCVCDYIYICIHAYMMMRYYEIFGLEIQNPM